MEQEYIYHFTSVENLLKIVISNRFMLNSISNMNDIQESEKMNEDIYFDCFSINKENEWEKRWDITKKMELFFKASETDVINNRNATRIEYNTFMEENEHRKKMKKTINDLTKNIYIASFTKSTNDNEIKEEYSLWSHYAQKNSGVAIKLKKERVIDIFENQNITALVKSKFKGDVQYSKNIKKLNIDLCNAIKNSYSKEKDEIEKLRIEKLRKKIYIDHLDAGDEQASAIANVFTSFRIYNHDSMEPFFKKALEKRYCSKHSSWEYENEYRLGVYAEEHDEKYIFINGINNAIEGIILGPAISEPCKYIIEKINENFFRKDNFIV